MGAVERKASLPLGVVVERRELDNRWQRWRWQAVDVIPGAPPVEEWRELAHGQGFVRWHAATLPLELHRTDTDSYRYNLSGRVPEVYVVLRRGADAEGRFVPVLVTASPYEAQSYGESGEEVVGGVAMPEGLIAWVQAFIDRHHVDRPFVKRRRERDRPERPAAADAVPVRRGRDGGA